MRDRERDGWGGGERAAGKEGRREGVRKGQSGREGEREGERFKQPQQAVMWKDGFPRQQIVWRRRRTWCLGGWVQPTLAGRSAC